MNDSLENPRDTEKQLRRQMDKRTEDISQEHDFMTLMKGSKPNDGNINNVEIVAPFIYLNSF